MKIDVRAVNFQLSESLGDHAERSVHAALDRFESRIGWVNLRLTDDHGSRHGTVMHCCLETTIPGYGPLLIEQDAADLYEAIDRAAGRMKRTVRRRLNRRRERKIRPRPAG